jgi:protein CMS1
MMMPISRKKGAPLLLILCPSARRCVEWIHRYLKNMHGKYRIAKLFAKHFKSSDQINYLNTHEIEVAVATPHRLTMLLTEKALDTSNLQLVLIDIEKDAKQMTLLELHDTRQHLCELFHYHLSRLMIERRSTNTPLHIGFICP